jgi:hypothetical protein
MKKLAKLNLSKNHMSGFATNQAPGALIEINFQSEMETAVIGHAFSKRISAPSVHPAVSLEGTRN